MEVQTNFIELIDSFELDTSEKELKNIGRQARIVMVATAGDEKMQWTCPTLSVEVRRAERSKIVLLADAKNRLFIAFLFFNG